MELCWTYAHIHNPEPTRCAALGPTSLSLSRVLSPGSISSKPHIVRRHAQPLKPRRAMNSVAHVALSPS